MTALDIVGSVALMALLGGVFGAALGAAMALLGAFDWELGVLAVLDVYDPVAEAEAVLDEAAW